MRVVVSQLVQVLSLEAFELHDVGPRQQLQHAQQRPPQHPANLVAVELVEQQAVAVVHLDVVVDVGEVMVAVA